MISLHRLNNNVCKISNLVCVVFEHGCLETIIYAFKVIVCIIIHTHLNICNYAHLGTLAIHHATILHDGCSNSIINSSAFVILRFYDFTKAQTRLVGSQYRINIGHFCKLSILNYCTYIQFYMI